LCAEYTFPDAVNPELSISTNDSNICPGETVAFTCETHTRTTDSHTWKVKYLGNQLQIIIITGSDNGTVTMQSSDKVVTIQAILTESFDKNDFTVLRSALSITTATQNTGYGEYLSVICQNDELKTTSNVTLMLDEPGNIPDDDTH
jgi:hypothetical protein